MESSRRPIGIAVADERPLAGRIVGWMFVVGAIVTTLLPLLPGAHGEVVTPTLPIGIGAFVWGVVALRRVTGCTRRAGSSTSRSSAARWPPRSPPTTPAAPARPRASC